jgi:hypothetical protein
MVIHPLFLSLFHSLSSSRVFELEERPSTLWSFISSRQFKKFTEHIVSECTFVFLLPESEAKVLQKKSSSLENHSLSLSLSLSLCLSECPGFLKFVVLLFSESEREGAEQSLKEKVRKKKTEGKESVEKCTERNLFSLLSLPFFWFLLRQQFLISPFTSLSCFLL